MIKRRLKLTWGNINWGFIGAMFVSFILVIAVIVMVGWAITLLSGCSEQVAEVTDARMYVRTTCFMRGFTNSGGKLVVGDPNGRWYELTFGDHESKTSTGTVRLVHPSGIAGEVVVE